jgi:hypothetical protein
MAVQHIAIAIDFQEQNLDSILIQTFFKIDVVNLRNEIVTHRG